MPLRSYPISNPIPLRNDDPDPDSYYYQSTPRPPRPPPVPDVRTGARVWANPDVKDKRVKPRAKPIDRYVGHSIVGQQAVPNDVVSDDDDLGYYDVLDIYTLQELGTTPGYADSAGQPHYPQPTAPFQSRGRVPAFPTKHVNASTPALSRHDQPKKKPSASRLATSSSKTPDMRRSPSEPRKYSRYSKPLPAPPLDQSHAPPVPRLPGSKKVEDNRLAFSQLKNRSDSRDPTYNSLPPRVVTRNQARIHTPRDEPGIVGQAAEIIKQVDDFLEADRSLGRGYVSKNHRRRYDFDSSMIGSY